MIFDVDLWFNGRLTGTGQCWSNTVEAESVREALDMAIADAVRDPRLGYSIYVTGCNIRERKARR